MHSRSHVETPERLPVVRPLQPFGVRAAVCAGRRAAGVARSRRSTWPTIGWILVAMVAARSAAMGFNRLVDARFDALNPRTANREMPRGAMSVREATLFVVVVVGRCSSCAAWRLNPHLSGCCRRWRWRSCSGIRWPSATPPGRSCSSAWRWRWRRSAAGWRSAAAAAGSRGCWRRRSAPGWAASTSSTPARTSTSIARTACARFRCASACRRR